MAERDRSRALVLVQRVSLPARQVWLGLLAIGAGAWLVVLAGTAGERPLVLPVALLGMTLVQATAGVIVWWQEQQAECEAAQSQLRLEHAAAEVQTADEREFVIFD